MLNLIGWSTAKVIGMLVLFVIVVAYQGIHSPKPKYPIFKNNAVQHNHNA